MTIYSYFLQFIRKSIPHAEEASSYIRFKFKDNCLTVNYGQEETFHELWKLTPTVKSPYHVNYKYLHVCFFKAFFSSDIRK